VINTLTSYRLLTRDIDRSLTQVESQPMVSRETEYYRANIEKVKSIDDFMADDRLFQYAMKAHGLSDMTYAKAFIRKALEGGIDASDSFANKLTDGRYKDFVSTFNFVRNGENTTLFEKTREGVVDRYLRQTLEEDAGRQNEGVRLALYFERKAPTITNAYELLADPALSKVVRTALGFPEALAQADIDKQAALIEDRLDFADLKDPEKLAELMTRFATLWEVNNPSATMASSPINVLFTQQPEFGISTDVLLTLQRMKI
jgi:hypothetical protein